MVLVCTAVLALIELALPNLRNERLGAKMVADAARHVGCGAWIIFTLRRCMSNGSDGLIKTRWSFQILQLEFETCVELEIVICDNRQAAPPA
jgi:hypothetical protein